MKKVFLAIYQLYVMQFLRTRNSILTKPVEVKSIPPNLKEKKQSLTFYIFYILIAFLLISMTIIDIISKHQLPFHDTNIKFKVGYY